MEPVTFTSKLHTQFAVDLHVKAFNEWVKELSSSQQQYSESKRRADINYSICRFISYNQRKHISSPENDITYWFNKPYQDFQKLIFQLDQAEEERQLQKGLKTAVDIIFENNSLLIVKPNTYQAAMKYGKNTKWCVTYSHSMTAFKRYTNNGFSFFYLLPKNQSNGKIVIYTLNGKIDHATDQEDNYLFDDGDVGPRLYFSIKNLLPVTDEEWFIILNRIGINVDLLKTMSILQ